VDNVVFCGGQISADAKGRTVAPGDIERQTQNVFEAINTVLAEGGADMSDVVKLNTYYHYDGEGRAVTDYWERMTKVRKRYFPPQGPSATAVRVKCYAYEDLLIEVEQELDALDEECERDGDHEHAQNHRFRPRDDEGDVPAEHGSRGEFAVVKSSLGARRSRR